MIPNIARPHVSLRSPILRLTEPSEDWLRGQNSLLCYIKTWAVGKM